MHQFLTGFFLTLAVLSAVYGVTVFAAGSGTPFFLVWIAGGAVFLLLALMLRGELWARIPAVVRGSLAVLVCLALALFLFCESLVLRGFHWNGDTGLDILIVLGAQIHDDGPSVVLRYRLDRAAEYLEENPETLCIVSGGQGYNEPRTEASAMREYLLARGISEDRIQMEEKSKNTAQNIRYSMALFDPENDRVGVLTNNFHLYRSVAIARKQGILHVCGIAARSTPIYLPNNMVREFFGILKDKMAGNL